MIYFLDLIWRYFDRDLISNMILILDHFFLTKLYISRGQSLLLLWIIEINLKVNDLTVMHLTFVQAICKDYLVKYVETLKNAVLL